MLDADNSLSNPVDPDRDHIRGPANAPVTLLAYSDYQCPHCHKLRAIINDLETHLGDRIRVVFRHFPINTVHPLAQKAAEAAEAAGAQGKFWEMHEHLFVNQSKLSEEALHGAASTLGLDADQFKHDLDHGAYAGRVGEDIESAKSSGVTGTPGIFINDIRYDGPWDFESLLEAIEKPLGLRVEVAARRFANWAASGGFMLLVASFIALAWANSPWGESYFHLWESEFSFRLGANEFGLSLHHWVNDGLMVLFFFLVGLEIKREVLLGELADPKRAALPIAAALGGMIAPAVIYSIFNAGGPGSHGWGVPMATDIAFTLGLLAMLGRRVPFSLIVFVSALAIADDLGAIVVIALFYSSELSLASLGVAGAFLLVLIGLARARVRRPLPYAILGAGLWFAVLQSGIHPTIAGVALAMTIPLGRQPDTGALLAQSATALHNQDIREKRGMDDDNETAVRTLETVMSRLDPPAERIRRRLDPWIAYLVLPLFALANAGVVLNADAVDLTNPVSVGIILGLVVGKPLGITLFAWAATAIGIAQKPDQIEWAQLFGAACLCGIGFTMSMFIATAGFADPALLATSKISIIIASALAAILGWILLTRVSSKAMQATKVETVTV